MSDKNNKIVLYHIVPLTRGQKALMKAIHQPLVNRRGIFVYKNYKDFLDDFARVVKEKLPPLTQQIERALESKHVYDNLGLFVLYADPKLLEISSTAIETKKSELKQRKGRFNPELLKSVFADKELFIPEEDFRSMVAKVEGPKIINIADLARDKLGININDVEDPAKEKEENSDKQSSTNVSSHPVVISSEPDINITKDEIVEPSAPDFHSMASSVEDTNIAAKKFLYLERLLSRIDILKSNVEFMDLMNKLTLLFNKGQQTLSDEEYKAYSKLSGKLYNIIQEL